MNSSSATGVLGKSRGLLFAALLAAGCVSDSAYKQEEQKANSLSGQNATLSSQNATYQKLDSQLQTEVKADQVQIQQLQGELKVVIVNEILFPEGGWQLNHAGEQTLDKIVPTLKTLEKQRIEVDGYTDNVPIGPELKNRFPSNWELSTARATDVVRYLVSQGVSPNLLSATGFGDTQPVASNDTAAGRAKNRRIELALKPVAP
jgi:chemotaxis protein MotB